MCHRGHFWRTNKQLETIEVTRDYFECDVQDLLKYYKLKNEQCHVLSILNQLTSFRQTTVQYTAQIL